MPTVHLLCEQFAGELRSSSFVRLLLPLTHPTNAPHFEVTTGTNYQKADVVVVERTWLQDPDKVEDLLECVRRDGACLIYSIDDDLLVLGRPGPLQKPFMTAAKVRLIERLAREANGIIVSTERLKTRMLSCNNNVFTVPNAIDERLFADGSPLPSAQPVRCGRLVMGCVGTCTHDDDLAMIVGALRRSLVKHQGTLELELVGFIGDPASLEPLAGLPVRVLRPDDAMPYPEFIPWLRAHACWDFALAPLVDNAFTRCKSPLKFFDYAALGIPGIYSRTPTYEDAVVHGETGYLVDNAEPAWEQAIDHLVSSAPARVGPARRARDHVLGRHTLRHQGASWRDAIQAIAAGCTAPTPDCDARQRRRLVDRMRSVACRAIPVFSTVLVASRGNDEWLDLGERRSWHFPRRADGQYAGSVPADGPAAIAHFEELRRLGAEYAVFPAPALWWVERHADFRRHLDERYRILAREDACLVYSMKTQF
jgi:hypothetical protein